MSNLIKPSSTDEEEDATSIFESSIYSLFDIHIAASGDPGCEISYSNPRLAAILPSSTLKYYIPKGDKEQNGLMAQFQWDAGLVLADLICETNEMQSEVGIKDQEQERKRNGVALELDGTPSKDSDRIRNESRSTSFKVRDKSKLELGAGTGLPSLVGSLLGSSKGVITDYPSPDILETLKRNIVHLNHQLISDQRSHESRTQLFVEALEWGKKPHEELALSHLEDPSQGFDLVLTTDTLWLTKSHKSLIKTLKRTLRFHPDSRIFLVAGFHTGRDVISAFFEKLFRFGRDELMKEEEAETTDSSDERNQDQVKRTEEQMEKEKETEILNRKLIPDSEASMRFGGIWERSFKGEERGYLNWNEDWLNPERSDFDEKGSEKDLERLKKEESDDDRDERAKWCVIACLKWEI